MFNLFFVKYDNFNCILQSATKNKRYILIIYIRDLSKSILYILEIIKKIFFNKKTKNETKFYSSISLCQQKSSRWFVKYIYSRIKSASFFHRIFFLCGLFVCLHIYTSNYR